MRKSKRKLASFIIGFTIASVAIGGFSFVIIKKAFDLSMAHAETQIAHARAGVDDR